MQYYASNIIVTTKTVTVFFVVFAILALFDCASAQPFVTTNGPYRPRVLSDVSIGKYQSSSIPQKMYISYGEALNANKKPLEMSTDNGLTWSYVNFPGAAVLATCAPNNPNVVFGQRWLNFIHYTDDGGASTWEEVQGQHYPMTQKISISPHDTRIAFLGTKRENAPNDTVMWKWNFENGKFEGHPYFKNIAQTNINDILPFPLAGARGNYVWAGGSSKSVYSFALDSTESEDVDDSTDEEGNIEFGPVTKGLWRSSDAGLNWSYLKKVGGSGGSGDKNIIALAFAIVPPDTFLYAITKKSKGKGVRVWRSKNFGEDWGSAMSVIQKNTVTHVRTLKVHPTTPTTLVAGTDNGFAYSDDGGFTWEIRNTGMNERDIYQLAFTPSGDTIFAATYSSLFRTTDFGMN
ncbi:MAG: hypothetical protein AAB071_02295 [Bacteroidota bacterium]